MHSPKMAPSHTTKKEDPKKKEGPPDLSNYQDILDPATFDQILEMDDDDEEHDFSKGIVYGFFEQAEATFEKMEKAFSNGDFNELSQLGHFLKGSSATLGLTKVKDACERIQHCKEELPKKDHGPEREKALEGIKHTLEVVQVDYKEVANLLRRFFGEDISDEATTTTTETTEKTTDESKKSASPEVEKRK